MLLVLLIGVGSLVLVVSAWGITMAEKQERRKKLEAERLVDRSAWEAQQQRLVAQARALATIDARREDAELRQLRRLAGLDKESGTAD